MNGYFNSNVTTQTQRIGNQFRNNGSNQLRNNSGNQFRNNGSNQFRNNNNWNSNANFNRNQNRNLDQIEPMDISLNNGSLEQNNSAQNFQADSAGNYPI